jgi:hypothetical protein
MFMNLKSLIKKILLSEAKKNVIIAKPTGYYTIDFRYTLHAKERSVRSGIEDYDKRPITRQEVSVLLENIGPVIADHLMTMEIIDGVPFVIKSLKLGLAVSVKPLHEGGVYWKFIVTTVFRESSENQFRTGPNQLVINV